MKINEYIESGILEAYVLGAASNDEAKELLYLKAQHPEIEEALAALEMDLERIAEHMAITPPPDTWSKIEDGIHELVRMRESEIAVIGAPGGDGSSRSGTRRKDQFIEVEASDGHMRIRKAWRWVFAAVFLLGKIFLGFAIYYYLENRHNEAELKQLKMELRQNK